MKLEDLNTVISQSVTKLSDELLRIWEEIKVSPEEWIESQKGKFWVVAIMGNEVIWYNDIEEGFNVSAYKNPGEISEYWNEDTDLHDLLWHLF